MFFDLFSAAVRIARPDRSNDLMGNNNGNSIHKARDVSVPVIFANRVRESIDWPAGSMPCNQSRHADRSIKIKASVEPDGCQAATMQIIFLGISDTYVD